MELRVPVTVTERLQAQSMLGIGQTVSPARAQSLRPGTPAAGDQVRWALHDH